MINPFDNKQKQEALEKKKEEYTDAVENILSLLHPNTRGLLAKDFETFENYVDTKDRSVPVALLFLMSKVDYIIERLDLLEEFLASTVEGDSSETDTKKSL